MPRCIARNDLIHIRVIAEKGFSPIPNTYGDN
jgi:hypothetical protein